VTAGTLFHSINLPLTKWFWAVYWMGSDQGGISALQLAKLLDVSWPTAHRRLRKLRMAVDHRARLYRLHEWLEVDDALVGGKRSGKRGRGARRRVPRLTVTRYTAPMQQDKPTRYVGIDKDLYGGMTDPGRIIRDAWAFGLIPESETCAGWNAQAIGQLWEKTSAEWTLVQSLRERPARGHPRALPAHPAGGLPADTRRRLGRRTGGRRLNAPTDTPRRHLWPAAGEA
jgi:hypothetical protein